MLPDTQTPNSQQSDAVDLLFGAVSAFLGEVEAPTKNAVNPHFKNRYADLAQVLHVARPVLAKHGLAILQTTGVYGSQLYCVTTLGHRSGQWMRGYWPIQPTKADPQGYGSALTYARRYGASAILGLAPEDDDGETAIDRNPPLSDPQAPPPDKIDGMIKAFAELGIDENTLQEQLGKPLQRATWAEFNTLTANYRTARDAATKPNGKRSVTDIVRERQQ